MILRNKTDLKFFENSSLEPLLASTFNVAMPYKDSLFGISSIAPPIGVSTIYNKDFNSKGFKFNNEKPTCDSPTIQKSKPLDSTNIKKNIANKYQNTEKKKAKKKNIINARERGKHENNIIKILQIYN